MARPLRIQFPGAVYHVTTRGNDKSDIYRDDADRGLFLHLLAECVKRFGWIITAYVLMSNHYHLVVELTRSNLSRGLQWLNGCYSQAFNRRYEKVGHLFQARPDTPLIEKEVYLLNVLRYVVLNPVRANMVRRPEEYSWSSYRSTAGLAEAPDWLHVDEVLALFSPDRAASQVLYRDFVHAGIGHPSPWKDLVSQIYLGSGPWLQKMRERVESRPRDSEHPRVQRTVIEPAITDVVASVAATLSVDANRIRDGRGGLPRMLAAWIGCYEGQLPLSTIAAGLRMRSTSHVSRLIRQCEEELRRNETLQNALDRCLATLRGGEKSIEGQT